MTRDMIDPKLLLARLEALRANPTEDAVLDLMDEVEGWCAPHRTLAYIKRLPRLVADEDVVDYRLGTPEQQETARARIAAGGPDATMVQP